MANQATTVDEPVTRERAAPGEGGARLAGAAAILMAAFVASRLTGLLREVAITSQFGVSREMDAYVAAFRIPDFVFQIFAGGAVAAAFIPIFNTYIARDDEQGRAEGWRLVSILFTVSAVALSPVIALLIIFAPTVMSWLAPQFEPEYQAMAADLARILLVSPLFFAIGCFTSSVLNSYKRFFLAALAPTTYNLGIILGAVVLAPSFGVYGLALGATFGSLMFLLVQVPGLFQVGMRYRPILDIFHPGVRQVGALMLPRVLGLAVVQANFIVTVFLASGIEGGPAALNWAWALTMLPLGIFGMAIGTAVFPSLAEQTAREQLSEMSRIAVGALRMVLFLTIPASVGLIVLAEPIVRLLFERGAFQESSTEAVAGALQLYAVGLVGMASLEIVTRAFYALKDTKTPVAVGFGAMLLNLTFALALLPVLGFRGLALATGVASLIEAGVMFAFSARRLPDLMSSELLQLLLKSGAAAVVMGSVLFFVVPLVEPVSGSSLVGQALLVGSSVTLGAATYLTLSFAFGAEEVRRVWVQVAGRLGR